MAPINAEEAARQLKRKVDHELRGLAYFDNFDDLAMWKEADVDPLQRANTPFLKRSDTHIATKTEKTSNVMLMHDYRGGYLQSGYEGCQGAISSDEDYILEQWQRVEAFNYFTHNRVTIPPATWVNAGHRNGAMVLGTFCIEGADDHPGRILEKGSDGKYWLAHTLARMAAYYGFDGWLMNVEVTIGVSSEVWDDGKALEAFLNQLKEELKDLPSGGKVIWYDALTKGNEDHAWQNTLNDENVAFARAAGSITTNYWWTPEVQDAAANCAKYIMPLNTVYFGADCWGQTDGRQTFGIAQAGGVGGVGVGTGFGGTATGLAVKQTATHGLGSGIFASGWAYEHFLRREVDRFMWEGEPDLEPLGLQCACKNSIQNHLRSDFKDNPIAKFATQYPAGTESFFYSDYKDASYRLGTGQYLAHIGQQSVLPTPAERHTPVSITPKSDSVGILTATMNDEPSRCSIGITIKDLPSISNEAQVDGKLYLHKLSARGDLNLDLNVTYLKLVDHPDLKTSLFAVVGSKTVEQILVGDAKTRHTQTVAIWNTSDRVTAVGVAVRGPAHYILSNSASALLDIFELTLKPTGHHYPKSEIQSIRFEQHGTSETTHHRLVWSIPGTPHPSNLLPYSSITGPFSHFIVSAEGKDLGRAYALAYIVDQKVYADWKAQNKATVSVTLTGYAFDGSIIGSFSDAIPLT